VRWRFFFWEALASIRSNAATTVAATVTVLIVTFLLGIFVTTAWWVYHYAVGVRNEVTVKLYLPESYATNAAQRGDVANQVKQLPYVSSFHYVSPSAAAKMLPPAEQAALKRIPNPLPPAFYVKLTDANQASATAAAAQRISAIHNCGSPPCVTYGKEDHRSGVEHVEVHPVFRVRVDVVAGDRGGGVDSEHDPVVDFFAAA